MAHSYNNIGTEPFVTRDDEVISGSIGICYSVTLSGTSKRVFICQDGVSKTWHIDMAKRDGTFGSMEQAVRAAVAIGRVHD